MKSSITKVQIKQKLYTYHIAGDDRNLADHGNEREYLYSVGDGYRLLLDIREKQLNRGNTFLAAANEQNAAFRENHKRIFLSDPYYTNSFDEYFEDDISRIINGKGEQSSWRAMPETIIIPIIDGVHWRLIRIKISYIDRNADILWDDPFGENFSTNLRTNLKISIKDKITKLIKKQCGDVVQLEDIHDFINDDNDYFKVVDQQGRLSNFYDCGPIVFSNVRDYIENNNIENQKFSLRDDHYYTIKLYNDRSHEQILQRIRKQDKKYYIKFANPDLIDLNRLTALNTKISTGTETYKQNLSTREIGVEISKLSDIYISLFHEIIERNRFTSNEITDLEEYTENELKEAYKNLQEEIMSTPIEEIELDYEKFRELKRYQLDPGKYSKGSFTYAVYNWANFYTMDGPDLQVGIERNIEKIQRDIHLYKDYTHYFLKLGIRILHDSYIYTDVKLKIIESLGLFGRSLPATEKEIVVQHLKSLIRFQDRAQNYQILEIAIKSFLNTITSNYELNTLKIWLKKYFIPLFKDPDFSMGVLYNPDHFSRNEPIFKILFELVENLEDKKELFLFFLEELQNPNWEIKRAISSIFSAPSEHGISLEEFELKNIFSILSSLQSVLETDIVDEYYTAHTVLNIFKAKSYIFKLFDDNSIHRKIIDDHFSLLRYTNTYYIFLESTRFFISSRYEYFPNNPTGEKFLKDKTPLREVIGEDGIINLLQILLLRAGGIAFEKTAKFSVFTVSYIEDIKDRAGSLLTLFAYDENYSNHPLLNWDNYHEYSRKLEIWSEEHRKFSNFDFHEKFKLEGNNKIKKNLVQLTKEILEALTQEDAETIFNNVVKDIHNSDLRNKSPNSITFFIRIYMDSDFPRLKYMAMEQLTNIVNLLYKNISVLTARMISRLSNIEERLEYREIVEQIIDFLKYGVIENPTISDPLKTIAKNKLAEITARNHPVEEPSAAIGDNGIILDVLEVNIRDNSDSYLVYFSRAKFLIDTNQNIELALQDLNKAQKLNDFYAPIYFYKALYFEKMRDISGAIYQLEMAISIRPCYIEAYNKKITLHYEENDWVMARITYEEIVSLYPGYTDITQSYIRKLTKNIDLTDVPFRDEFDKVYKQLAEFSENELENEDSLKILLKQLEEFVPIDILDFCVERYQPSHANQLNDHLNEKRRFLEDFIKYIVINTVYIEYSQHYLVFQNEEERGVNLNKLFEESKIHKLFNQDNPSELITELRQYCEVCTTFELIEKYSVSDQLRDGYALGISDDLARTYDIFPKIFGLHRWEAAYGNFWIYDSKSHTEQFFTKILQTNKKIVFFVPTRIGDADDGVTRDEVLWVAKNLKDNPALLENIILVFDAYNYLPFYSLTRYYPTTAPEVDVDRSLMSIKNFILDYVLSYDQHAQFISTFETNVRGFAERNLAGEIYYEIIRVAKYHGNYNNQQYLKSYLDRVKFALDNSVKQNNIESFYNSLSTELIETNQREARLITAIFILNILADPEYIQLINQNNQFSELQKDMASRVIGLFQENGKHLTGQQLDIVFGTMFDLLERDSTIFLKDDIVTTITSFLKSVQRNIDYQIEELGNYLSEGEIIEIYQTLCSHTEKVQENLETLERIYSFLSDNGALHSDVSSENDGQVLLCIDALVDPSYTARQDKAFSNFAYQLQLGAQEFHESHRKLLTMEKSDGSNNFDVSSTAFGVQQGIEFAPTVRYFFKIFGIDLPKINLLNEFWGVLHFSVGVIKIKQQIDLLPGQMLESGSYYAKLVIYDKLSLQINSEKPINLITFVKACNVDMLVGGTLGLASGSPMYGTISGAAICLNKYQISQEESFLQTSIRFVLDGAVGLLAMTVLYQQNPLVCALGIMNVVVMTDITAKVTLSSIELSLNGINSTIFTDDYNEA